MFAWRRAVSAIVIALFALALGVSAHAQFGSLLKKAIPKPASPVAPAPEQRAFGAGVTNDDLDRLIKALKARVVGYERAQAAARASKATEERINQNQAKRMMAAMEKQGACEDAAKEKDPRNKESNRLNELSNAAHDKGDQAAGDKYSEQASALNDALDAMAKKLCTGDCAAKAMAKDPKQSQVAEKEQAAAREKDPNKKAQLEGEAQYLRGTMLIEAEMSCGAMGAAKPTAAEQAETDAAAEAAKKAKDNVDSEALAASGLSAEDFARLGELALGVCGGSSATPATPDTQAAIKPRCGELTSAMKAAGVS